MNTRVNSLADLEAIRERACQQLSNPQNLAINVGLASCGIAAGAKATLEAAAGELAPLGVEVRRTGCLGYCEMEPLVEVLGPGANAPRVVYKQVTKDRIAEVVRAHQSGDYRTEWALGQMTDAWSLLDEDYGHHPSLECLPGMPNLSQIPFYAKQFKIALRNCGYIDPDNIEHYIARGGYLALWRALTQMEPDQIVEEMIASGLRGRGGAGFPTGMKWRFMAQNQSDVKYVIVNADEGDPGAYMDRSVLEGDPHSVIEGLAIAARATGARHGYIYARHEYPLAVKRLQTAIDLATQRGLLGTGILGSDFDFDITISTGAGAFVCGEETALMASIMGDTGRPRPRPPFPAQSGLWGKPSNINNVETTACVPAIVHKGGQWFASVGPYGQESSAGTKVFSLVGKVKNTGLVEVPIGISLREIVSDIGGGVSGRRSFKAVQTGGPSGGCIPQHLLDTKVDYETLAQLGAIMGSGGMIVMDQSTCMVDLGRYFIEFLMEESCGKCVPCREGLLSLHEILHRICQGQGELADLQRLRDLGETMKDFSLCGLGQTAPNPVLSTLRYFEEEFKAHILDKRCPAGVCQALVVSPCQNACPAGVDVPNYVALASEGRYRESWEVICERNPFPAACGRICSHPCETSCRRGELDQPVAIKDIKRAVTDWAWQNEDIDLEPFPVSQEPKMAVVGAGPAGLTCGYYLRQMGYPVVVFEAGRRAGGMLRQALPPFRLPPEVVDREIERITARGVEIRLNQRFGPGRRPEDLLQEGFAAVFVATGAPQAIMLDLPGGGQEVAGWRSGLEFLKSVCQGRETSLKGKVAVIGGGNVALDAARAALRLGAEEVTLYYRREQEDMPSSPEEIHEAIEEGVKFHFRAWPDRVKTEGGRVTGMVFAATECGQWDAQGRRAFERVEGTEIEVAADTILVCIGQRPDASFGGASDLEADRGGRLQVEENRLAASVEGVFGGGDLITGPGYVIDAIAAGRRAAVAMDDYVNQRRQRVILTPQPRVMGDAQPPSPEEISQADRARVSCLAVAERLKGFSEVEMGLTIDQCRREGRRCLRCDLESIAARAERG